MLVNCTNVMPVYLTRWCLNDLFQYIRAAGVAHKSLTDFVLDAACQAAEQTLLDQRLFMISGSRYQALLELLEQPERDNAGLADLFARRAPWAKT